MPQLNIDSPHRWPSEWETQAATWIAWPHNRQTWPGRFDSIPECFFQLAKLISETQPVYVLASAEMLPTHHLSELSQRSNIRIVNIPTNDAWIRDYGPTFVQRKDDRSLVGVCWKFNSWGNRYTPYDLDAEAAVRICQSLRCQRSMSALHCEGGALDCNGQDTLISSSNCLLNPNRNPGWSRQMVEEELKMQLGARKVLWIDGGGLEGDDTDGHIDQLARFVNRTAIIAAISSSPEDPNKAALAANVRALQGTATAEGEAIKVYTLPTPPPRFVGSSRVPESYCNFLVTNSTVIVPTFRSERTDGAAIELLADLFPTRRIAPLDAYELSWGLGAFHCASQHQPESSTNP
ncbi:MAG: agmatine deiminase family protein [Planctomycetota bacterium]